MSRQSAIKVRVMSELTGPANYKQEVLFARRLHPGAIPLPHP
jgi:hypothetical protein